METMLIRERYKVIRTLRTAPAYALVEAVDIQERETPSRLLNLYEGDLLHRYGRIYASVEPSDCPAFLGIFLEERTLAAVFENSRGEPIDQVFFGGDNWNWRDRLDFAACLLHETLLLSNLPPELSCTALLSENILVKVPEKEIHFRFMVLPTEELSARELPLLAGDHLRKILPKRLSSPPAETAFLDHVEQGAFHTIVQLYAAWREAEPIIRSQWEEYEKKNLVQKGLLLLKRWWKSRRGGSRQ